MVGKGGRGGKERREWRGRNGVDFCRRAAPGEAEIYRILRQVRGDEEGRARSSRPHNKHITVILKTIISRASQPRGDDLRDDARNGAAFAIRCRINTETRDGVPLLTHTATVLCGRNYTYFL